MIPAAVCFGFSLALGYMAVEWLLDSPAITPRWAGAHGSDHTGFARWVIGTSPMENPSVCALTKSSVGVGKPRASTGLGRFVEILRTCFQPDPANGLFRGRAVFLMLGHLEDVAGEGVAGLGHRSRQRGPEELADMLRMQPRRSEGSSP